MIALKQYEVHEAYELLGEMVKQREYAKNIKIPLIEKKKYKLYFYVTINTKSMYQKTIAILLAKGKDEIAKYDGLYCFQYDYKRDGWFIDDWEELAWYLTAEFDEFYEKHIVPDLKLREIKRRWLDYDFEIEVE